MKNIKNQLTAFIKNEEGVTTIEYAMIASMISIAIIAGVTNIGTVVHDNFFNNLVALFAN